MRNTLITILVGLSFVLALGAWTRERCKPPVVIEKKVPMSVRETQEFLNDQGHSRYKCKVDGIPGPETFKALDNWLNDQHYKESTYGK